jgi:hypothetical protein
LERLYALEAPGTFLLFSIGKTCQIFGNRLLIPFFLLSALLVGLVGPAGRAETGPAPRVDRQRNPLRPLQRSRFQAVRRGLHLLPDGMEGVQ